MSKLSLGLALLVALLAMTSGCKDSKPSSDSSGTNSTLSAPAPAPEVQRSVALPPHATEVASGSNETLTYKPDEDGAIYMTDEQMKRIVMRKNVRAGQSFEFSPSAGQAKLDGQVVFQLHPSKHEYKLYFEKLGH
jgi:hypothetical protein